MIDDLLVYCKDNAAVLEILGREDCLFALSYSTFANVNSAVGISAALGLNIHKAVEIVMKLKSAQLIDILWPSDRFILTPRGMELLDELGLRASVLQPSNHFLPLRPNVSFAGARSSGIEQGVVRWFNSSKGFGFIQRTSGEDVFVHYSAIKEDGHKVLNTGDSVEFRVIRGPKGEQAMNVFRANKHS
jgi:CspA family cold shock protein